ncbi:hypothetical protein BGW80DRAFT_1250754 [Lactifluus volemus]|nr:hypothetical protein BGW80DRAFT_1250754 [Lactifluus volemus]
MHILTMVRNFQLVLLVGGASCFKSLGKRLYYGEGNHPIAPGPSLLAKWLPFHPSRWWNHTRSCEIKASEDPLVLAVREQNIVFATDLDSPHSKLFDFIAAILGTYEQLNTGYQTLGPEGKRVANNGRRHVWHSQLWYIEFMTQVLAETALANDEDNKQDGGLGICELQAGTGPDWLELLEPAEVFAFVHAIEQPEGGWVDSWVIYATIFALESLSPGETYETSDSARRACDFLVGKRRENGTRDMRGLRMDHTQVIQTSWAVMAAKPADGHKRPLKGSSTGLARSYTQTSSYVYYADAPKGAKAPWLDDSNKALTTLPLARIATSVPRESRHGP